MYCIQYILTKERKQIVNHIEMTIYLIRIQYSIYLYEIDRVHIQYEYYDVMSYIRAQTTP